MPGLLALDPDGAVLGANPQARFLLQGLPALPGSHFADLFHTRLGSFLDGARTRERQRLDDLVGSAFVATIETFPQPRRIPSPPRASRVLPTDFIADDRRVAEVVRQVEAAAARKLPILIRGETGTGKEQLARHAHLAGRRTGEFVPLNCAALSDSLAEAELFGHADGAFTGARRGARTGLVVEADGGTLFLDEIGDMPLPLQAVLLRLLDDWTVRPVGGGKRRTVDVQVVAATNADLERAVTAGTLPGGPLLSPERGRGDLAAAGRTAGFRRHRASPSVRDRAGPLDHPDRSGPARRTPMAGQCARTAQRSEPSLARRGRPADRSRRCRSLRSPSPDCLDTRALPASARPCSSGSAQSIVTSAETSARRRGGSAYHATRSTGRCGPRCRIDPGDILTPEWPACHGTTLPGGITPYPDSAQSSPDRTSTRLAAAGSPGTSRARSAPIWKHRPACDAIVTGRAVARPEVQVAMPTGV